MLQPEISKMFLRETDILHSFIRILYLQNQSDKMNM